MFRDHEGIVAPVLDHHGSRELALGIEDDIAVQIVVLRIVVLKCVDVDEDQPVLAIGREGIAVKRMNRPFAILRPLRAAKVDGNGCGSIEVRGIRTMDDRAFAHSRIVSLRDALGERLVVDVGDIVDLEARWAFSGQHVLAAHGHRAHIGRPAAVGGSEFASARHECLVGGGVELLLEAASDDRLRLVTVGDFYCGNGLALLGNIRVFADEVECIHAESERRRDPGIVVVLFADVAIRAGLGLGGAYRVRRMRRHALVSKSGRRYHGLLMDDVVAAAVPGRHDDAGGGAEGRDFASVVVGSDTEEIHIGADHLLVVRSVGARLNAFIVQFRRLDVEIEGQMAARASGLPRRMAGEAFDLL